ncbi:bactericidal permeability-increasing protein [Cyprinodon tularosa]|uniref:bactericidal permeability-increasing protein n=1 Tax=Cyprinodon tularosa TaxID=77115 RepID=UPI0018E1FED4|nr:bactericidal permeability-increasing protein [Cyprinodon tularosa]
MLLSVTVFLMLMPCSWGENPAVQVILTNKGLQYGKHVGTGWVQDKLKQITLPDISGSVNIFIGDVHYTLSGVTIKKCDLPEPNVEFFKSIGLNTSITGLSFAASGEWSTRFGVIHDGGSFDMAIFNIGLISYVKLRNDAKGHLFATSIGCDASVGDVILNFYGGASIIFKPFIKYFKGHILRKIQEAICPAVRTAIMELDLHLLTMNVSYNVNEVLSLDVPLSGLPVIGASNLQLGFKGEFYSIKTHKEPPFEPQKFILPAQAGYMLSVGMSEFTLNSASYGYFSAGELHVLINDSMIPPGIPFHLNTSSMGNLIPQLPKMFPGLMMNLNVYAREAPLFSFQPGVTTLGVKASVKASAIEPNGTQVPLFTLNIDLSASFKMMIGKGKLMGSMAVDNITLSLASSEIGDFKIDPLETLMKTAVRLAQMKVNLILGKGIILPRMKYVQLVNTVLKMDKGFVAVFSDVETLQTDRNDYT